MWRSVSIVVTTAVALLLGGLSAPAGAGDPDLGRLWAQDKVLKRGCHNYQYQYRIKATHKRWAVETMLRDPRGELIASDAFDNTISRKRDSDTFRFCRYNTRPGQFKIRAKLTQYYKVEGLPGPLDDTTEKKVGWLKPGYFRMRLAS